MTHADIHPQSGHLSIIGWGTGEPKTDAQTTEPRRQPLVSKHSLAEQWNTDKNDASAIVWLYRSLRLYIQGSPQKVSHHH